MAATSRGTEGVGRAENAGWNCQAAKSAKFLQGGFEFANAMAWQVHRVVLSSEQTKVAFGAAWRPWRLGGKESLQARWRTCDGVPAMAAGRRKSALQRADSEAGKELQALVALGFATLGVRRARRRAHGQSHTALPPTHCRAGTTRLVPALIVCAIGVAGLGTKAARERDLRRESAADGGPTLGIGRQLAVVIADTRVADTAASGGACTAAAGARAPGANARAAAAARRRARTSAARALSAAVRRAAASSADQKKIRKSRKLS
jgi:hypothetical protein